MRRPEEEGSNNEKSGEERLRVKMTGTEEDMSERLEEAMEMEVE